MPPPMPGLYIHIPFCKKKCFYCDFFSVEYNEYLSSQYVEALSKHAGQHKGRAVDTIYVGGGTPSVLSEKQIERLLNSIKTNFNLNGLKEFTFELNPESASKDKLKILKNYGVDRLSMGLQSVDDNLLKKIGRIHDFEIFSKAYECARNEGFDNFNLDLMYGLPEQTLSSWKKSLKTVSDIGCEHISLYPLSIEENTPFYNDGIEINDNLQSDMYETAVDFLFGENFNHYEISNWAKPGKESAHNSNYWRNFEYIALGAGASGYENGYRYSNIENIAGYTDFILKGMNVKDKSEFINDEIYESEAIMLGLRLLDEGVDIKTFKSCANINALNELLREKKLINENKRIKLPKNTVFISNQIMSRFMKGS